MRRTSKEAVPDRFLDGNGEVAALADLERELIAFALAALWRTHVAGRPGAEIGRSTLYRKLREYGLDDEAKRLKRAATPPEPRYRSVAARPQTRAHKNASNCGR